MELNLNESEAEEELGIVVGDTAAITEFPLSADVHSCKQDPSHFWNPILFSTVTELFNGNTN